MINPEGTNPNPDADPDATPDIEATVTLLAAARRQLRRVILGQEAVVDAALTGLLAGGHVLLVGLPGLAKTRLVESLGLLFGMDMRRIQCTPDLMPADILGAEVLDRDADGRNRFRFIEGPIFCQVLMADEINRASPRTQSALLQAMQEQRVTIAGVDHTLPTPFHVLATQNPIEQEGTYPLPEAQLDRFLLEIDIGYPTEAAEREMLVATTGLDVPQVETVAAPRDLLAAQNLVRRVPFGDGLLDGVTRLVRAARPEQSPHDWLRQAVMWGPGPRAGQALIQCGRARALLDGRAAPSLDDIAALAEPVFRHRMALTYASRAEGTKLADLIARLVETSL